MLLIISISYMVDFYHVCRRLPWSYTLIIDYIIPNVTIPQVHVLIIKFGKRQAIFNMFLNTFFVHTKIPYFSAPCCGIILTNKIYGGIYNDKVS